MSIAFTHRPHFAQALHSRPFALLWAGQTVSALGDGAFVTALSWQALQLTGSAMAMGIVVLAQTLPMIFLLLLGGVVADRFPRQQVMLWSDASRTVAVLVIAALGMAHLLQLWHLVLLALFFGTVRGFFSPAYQSIIPQLVEKRDQPSANSLTELSYQLYCSIGPMFGATCVALAGPASAFAFDGLTFIVSALCLATLRLPAALAYLRASVNGAILDTLRRSSHPKEMPLPDADESHEAGATYQEEEEGEVWEAISTLLPGERECRVAYLLYHCGLKPREIMRYCSQEFSEIQEVYRLRRQIIERLMRNADRIRWRLSMEG